MSNDAAFESLQSAIDNLRAISNGDTRELHNDLAQALDGEIRKTIAAGTDPDGVKWQPTKRGDSPLKGAANTLRVSVINAVIVASIHGHDALHHLGRATGGVIRRILPTRVLPKPAITAFQRVYSEFMTSRFR